MAATNFPEYAREIQDILDTSVAAGEVEIFSAPTLAQVLDEILKGTTSNN